MEFMLFDAIVQNNELSQTYKIVFRFRMYIEILLFKRYKEINFIRF